MESTKYIPKRTSLKVIHFKVHNYLFGIGDCLDRYKEGYVSIKKLKKALVEDNYEMQVFIYKTQNEQMSIATLKEDVNVRKWIQEHHPEELI